MAPVPKSSEPFSSSETVARRVRLLRQDTYTSDHSGASTDTLYQKQRRSKRASALTVWLVFSEALKPQRKLLHQENYSSCEGSGTTFRSQRHKPRVQKEVCEVTKNKTKTTNNLKSCKQKNHCAFFECVLILSLLMLLLLR